MAEEPAPIKATSLTNEDEGGNDETNLIINYLPDDMTEGLLHDLFSTYGTVDNVRIIRDHITQAPRGYGFVKFKTSKGARAAMENLNGHKIMHKRLKVAISRPGGSRSNANLFVGSIPPTFNEDDLKELFVGFEPIIDVRILRFRDGSSKQCGFVRLDNDRSAFSAIKKLDGKDCIGYRIQVKLASGRSKKSNQNNNGNHNQNNMNINNNNNNNNQRRNNKNHSRTNNRAYLNQQQQQQQAQYNLSNRQQQQAYNQQLDFDEGFYRSPQELKQASNYYNYLNNSRNQEYRQNIYNNPSISNATANNRPQISSPFSPYSRANYSPMTYSAIPSPMIGPMNLNNINNYNRMITSYMTTQPTADSIANDLQSLSIMQTHSPILTAASTPPHGMTPLLVSSPYQGYSPIIVHQSQPASPFLMHQATPILLATTPSPTIHQAAVMTPPPMEQMPPLNLGVTMPSEQLGYQ